MWCTDSGPVLLSHPCVPRRCSMKYDICHQTLFSVPLEPNAFCGSHSLMCGSQRPNCTFQWYLSGDSPMCQTIMTFLKKHLELRIKALQLTSSISFNSTAVYCPLCQLCICLYMAPIFTVSLLLCGVRWDRLNKESVGSSQFSLSDTLGHPGTVARIYGGLAWGYL